MNNLEQIPLKEVIGVDGRAYLSFRKELIPKYGIVWRDITLGYLCIVLTIILFGYLERTMGSLIFRIALVPIFGLLAAFWVANIQLFIHEAAHYNIHPDKNKNDTLANIFIGWFTGISIEAYRHTHWKHHQNLGHTNDTEHSYFNGLTFVFLLKTITGIHALNVLLSREAENKGEPSISNKKQQIALVRGILIHITLISAFLYYGHPMTAIVWISAIIIFYPFFATIRQLLEHRDEKASKDEDFSKIDHGKVSRLFKDSPFSNSFGGAGFNRHLIHHWDPSVSYTRLAEVENFLERTAACEKIIKESQTTYLETFLKLIK